MTKFLLFYYFSDFTTKFFIIKITKQVHHIRQKFIEALQKEFSDLDLHYTVGGQISFDVSCKGWNKSYCLKFLRDYNDVFFFGDKTEKVAILIKYCLY